MWHFYNIIDDQKALYGDGKDKPNTIENIGYVLDNLEHGETIEHMAKVLKTTPEELERQIAEYKTQVASHIPDTVEFD